MYSAIAKSSLKPQAALVSPTCSSKSIFGIPLFETRHKIPKKISRPSGMVSVEGPHPRRRSNIMTDNPSSKCVTCGSIKKLETEPLFKPLSPSMAMGIPSLLLDQDASKRDKATEVEAKPQSSSVTSHESETSPRGATALSDEQSEKSGYSTYTCSAADMIMRIRIENETLLPGMVSTITDDEVANAKPVINRTQILGGKGEKEALSNIPTLKEWRKQEKRRNKEKDQQDNRVVANNDTRTELMIKKSSQSSMAKTNMKTRWTMAGKNRVMSKADKETMRPKPIIYAWLPTEGAEETQDVTSQSLRHTYSRHCPENFTVRI